MLTELLEIPLSQFHQGQLEVSRKHTQRFSLMVPAVGLLRSTLEIIPRTGDGYLGDRAELSRKGVS